MYGWVEHGIPILGWLLHSLIRGYFLDILCVNVLVYEWILLIILDIFVVFVISMYYDSVYKHV